MRAALNRHAAGPLASLRWLVLPLVVVIAGACAEATQFANSGTVGWALKQEVRDRRVPRVVLARLTPFAWDQLFLFDPRTPRPTICGNLGLSAAECLRVIPDASRNDHEMLMVFRLQGRVVHAEMHDRYHGDFVPLPLAQPVARDRAVFRVVPQGMGSQGPPWINLVLQ